MKYFVWFCITLVALSLGLVVFSILNPDMQLPVFLQFIGFIGLTLSPYLIGGMIFLLFMKWLIKEIKK